MESLNIKSQDCYNNWTDGSLPSPVVVTKIIKVDFMQDNQKQALRIAYCAGLLDGEGSICFIKQNKKGQHRKHGRKSPVYYGLIRIGLVSKDALEIINEVFPGSVIRCEGVRKDRPTYQVMYRWEMRKRKLLIPMLKTLIPYLVIKKRQAELLLETLSIWEMPYNKKEGMCPREIQRRDLAWEQMRQFNAVGAAATTKPQNIREDEAIV